MSEPARPCGEWPAPGPVDYDIPEAVLRTWADNCLTCVDGKDGERRYRFQFEGSTCMDGGAAFTANMQILLVREQRGVVVKDALIFFPEQDMGTVSKMCAYQDRGREFIEGLQSSPSFCGQTLEEALNQPVPTNPAGCFCTPPMVNHKWRLALSTLHYVLRDQRCEGYDTDGNDSST